MAIDPNVPPLAARREKDVPGGTVIPAGVRPGVCVGCGERVLMAESSHRLIASGGAQPVCFQCMEEHFHGPMIGVLPPGAEEERRGWDRDDAQRN